MMWKKAKSLTSCFKINLLCLMGLCSVHCSYVYRTIKNPNLRLTVVLLFHIFMGITVYIHINFMFVFLFMFILCLCFCFCLCSYCLYVFVFYVHIVFMFLICLCLFWFKFAFMYDTYIISANKHWL